MTFRFDRRSHRYFLDGEQVPSATQLLKRGGLVDERHYTEAGRERGTRVHSICADYDLGALTYEYELTLKPYVKAYEKAINILRPDFEGIEVALVDSVWRWGGRPDRELRIAGALGVLEVKTGAVERWHCVQTALHSLLVAAKTGLPANSLDRRVLYLKPNGRFTLDQHRDVRDLVRAQHLVQQYGGRNVNRLSEAGVESI